MFNELLGKILTLKFFEDMRNNIHDAIKMCYKIAIQKGNSSMEIAQARGEYDTLGDRITDLENRSKEDVQPPAIEEKPDKEENIEEIGGDD